MTIMKWVKCLTHCIDQEWGQVMEATWVIHTSNELVGCRVMSQWARGDSRKPIAIQQSKTKTYEPVLVIVQSCPIISHMKSELQQFRRQCYHIRKKGPETSKTWPCSMHSLIKHEAPVRELELTSGPPALLLLWKPGESPMATGDSQATLNVEPNTAGKRPKCGVICISPCHDPLIVVWLSIMEGFERTSGSHNHHLDRDVGLKIRNCQPWTMPNTDKQNQ